MLGDWAIDQTSPPAKDDQPRPAARLSQNASTVSSELLIHISDKEEDATATQEEGRVTPAEVRMSAQITFLQEQLNAALSQMTILEKKVAGQQEFIETQIAWNKSMSAESEHLDKKLTDESEQLNSRLVSTDAKAEAAHTAAKTADSIARKAADTANKSIQAAISHQSQLKALEASMTKISQAQASLSQARLQTGQQSAGPVVDNLTDTSENSFFFGGVPAFRDRLGLHPHSDPIFVVSRLLRDMGLYAGMDSIVLADNAAKSRLEVRAVIIHMRSSFHKRAATVILRRELASQRLPGTTVRDCFPASVMERVKRLNRVGLELKKAGKITKFQVVNRKGQPVLQTGTRNQNYADYQGDAEDEETADNGEWTLVENRRKRPHPGGTLTSPNSRPLEADRPKNNQPLPTAATWAALTEQEFPELGSQANPAPTKKQPTTAAAKTSAQPQAAQPQAAQRGAQQETGDQPNKKQPSGGPVEAAGGPHQPSRGPVETIRRLQQQTSRGPAEAHRGTQPGSYPASRASSQQNSRPSTPPPIRSLFDDDRSDDPRVSQKPKLQRQFQSKAAQHRQHSRNGY
jgi:hypothetical protein